MPPAKELMKFVVRIAEDDRIDVDEFTRLIEKRGEGREEVVRELIRKFIDRQTSEEDRYYTIKGYSDDHTRYADIDNVGGTVYTHDMGIEWKSADWYILDHAKDLVERGQPGDKEEAIKLFQSVFGERNVFVKSE